MSLKGLWNLFLSRPQTNPTNFPLALNHMNHAYPSESFFFDIAPIIILYSLEFSRRSLYGHCGFTLCGVPLCGLQVHAPYSPCGSKLDNLCHTPPPPLARVVNKLYFLWTIRSWFGKKLAYVCLFLRWTPSRLLDQMECLGFFTDATGR